MRYLLSLMLSAVLCLPLLAQAAGQKTLQNAASVSADGSNLATENAGAVGVSLTITNTATVTFKGSADGGLNWAPITCTNIDTLISAQTAGTTGQYQCPVAGLSHFETPAAITSGTVTSIATASPGSLGSSNASAAVSSLGTATAAAPSLAEGATSSFSFDLAGNARVTMGTLLSGEDQSNNLMMVGPGNVRVTSFGSVTSATSSAVTIVPNGAKTFVAQIINATSETKAATVTIYGNVISSTTGGIPVCTITLPSTATVLQLQYSCQPVTQNFSFWFYTASVYTSASSAPLTVYAQY